ncbi:MAG: ABC transporter permease [Lachnospiraceae bacterium]|nr:ABC transporter permease [Lachnospiraceae bacterium]
MTEKKSGKSLFAGIFEKREAMLGIIVIVLFIILSITNKNFLKWSNLKVVISSLSVDGIIVTGMTIVLISGGIDLSVGSTMCLSMTIAALLMRAGWNPWPASVVGIATAGVFGLLLGVMVTKLHLTHFIVSLCFMGIARGLVYILTSGSPISLVRVFAEHTNFAFLGQGTIGQFPMAPVCFIVIAVITEIYVRNSAGMRKVFYTGSNENAAKYAGIKVDKIKILACIACGALAGIAGIIYMIRYSGVAVSAGSGEEMIALSAAIIGGASMNGGRGSVSGSVLGLLFIVLIQDALTLMMVPSYWQDFIKYMIVLAAVSLDAITLYHSSAAKNK